MEFDISYIWQYLPKIFERLPYTAGVIVESAAVSFLLALPILFVRLKKIPVLSQLFEILLSFVRSMPGVLELFLIYFGMPRLFKAFGIDIGDWSGRTFVIIAMVFHYAPFLSEVLRPAYLSIENGQLEAADAIGMTPFQKTIRIAFPQMMEIAIPQLGNCLTDLIKDMSLLFTIGVIDLMGKAKLVLNNNYGRYKLETYLAVAVCYWILCGLGILLIRGLERYYDCDGKKTVIAEKGVRNENQLDNRNSA